MDMSSLAACTSRFSPVALFALALQLSWQAYAIGVVAALAFGYGVWVFTRRYDARWQARVAHRQLLESRTEFERKMREHPEDG